jgi:exopolysaccharide biosynthesis polyprenyl glycosylphosphotransferase
MTIKIRDESAWAEQAEYVCARRLSKEEHTRKELPIGRAVAPLVLLDAMCIAFSMYVAYQLRFRILDYDALLLPSFYVNLALVSTPMWVLVFAMHGLYNASELFGGVKEYARVFNACTVGLVGLILYSFLVRHVDYEISRGWLATVWVLSATSVAWMRFGYRRLIYRLREQGYFTRRVLIVGANEEGQALAEQLQMWPRSGVQIVGFVHPGNPEEDSDDLPVLHDLNRLETWIEELKIEELIVVPTALRRQELLDVYRDWGTDEHVRIRLSSGLYELFTTGIEVNHIGFVPLVSLNQTRITGADALLKTALDYVGAFALIVGLSPLLLGIAAMIRLRSGKPVLHRRRVIGLHGHEFDAFKFRTMIPDADGYLESHPELKEEWKNNGKIQEDPRVTKVGRLLRSYSLDELPQLFNVLRGEMSLVGPRMITPEELTHFGRWKHNLLTVKPGMTGLWQVSGRADLGYEDRVRLDMAYIRNYTIWLDFRVLFNTLWVVVSRQGAY